MTTAPMEAERILREAGLRGSILARDLHTHYEAALEPTRTYPIASLAKLPLAIAVLDLAHQGQIDLSTPVTIDAAQRSRGGPGLAQFQYPATIAVGDLVHLALEISDNSAADALFRLVPPEHVNRWLHRHRIRDLVLRHPIEDLYTSLALRLAEQDAGVITELVVTAGNTGSPSPLPELDPNRANTGTATAFADLLQTMWDGRTALPREVSETVRAAMRNNLIRHRLAPDFDADSSIWASKTGSFIHLRHEAGVVDHRSGESIIVVALTASTIPVETQPRAEQAIGHAARILHDDVLDHALNGR